MIDSTSTTLATVSTETTKNIVRSASCMGSVQRLDVRRFVRLLLGSEVMFHLMTFQDEVPIN